MCIKNACLRQRERPTRLIIFHHLIASWLCYFYLLYRNITSLISPKSHPSTQLTFSQYKIALYIGTCMHAFCKIESLSEFSGFDLSRSIVVRPKLDQPYRSLWPCMLYKVLVLVLVLLIIRVKATRPVTRSNTEST